MSRFDVQPGNGRMNAVRASVAGEVLEHFMKETGQSKRNEDDHKDAVGDLICNLMHYARSKYMDPHGIAHNAINNFDGEEQDDE